MKFKKGDTVRIRKDLENVLFDMPEHSFTSAQYAGLTTVIENVKNDAYILRIDNGKFIWPESCFEPAPEENHPMSAADILREISMLVEIMGLKEFDIQCTEGVINFSMAKNVEE